MATVPPGRPAPIRRQARPGQPGSSPARSRAARFRAAAALGAGILGGLMPLTVTVPASAASTGVAASASPANSSVTNPTDPDPTDPTNPTGTTGEPTRGPVEREPTPADLQAQEAAAAQLRAAAQKQAEDVADAQQALAATTTIANQTLEQYATAVRALRQAQGLEQQRADALAAATLAVQQRRQALGQWAREAYQSGTLLDTDPLLGTLLGVTAAGAPSQAGTGPGSAGNGAASAGADLGADVGILRRIGDSRSRALNELERAQRAADTAEDAAAEASDRAAAAAIDAADTRRASQQAVAEQTQALGLAETSLSRTRAQGKAAADQAAATRARLEAGARLAESELDAGTGRTSNAVTGAVGDCAGGDVAAYPNGQIPLSALCPLQAAPGQYLRADAAFAFDRLSYAYAQAFGRPIAITDSYRSFAIQVQLYATKPNLAAVPGTSNHGWGTAVDLGGGIQDFDTPEHRWMLDNAPQYGWFHPGWAEPTGSRPEPWHWEYAG